MNPIVSVIIPCYNQARFLPEAVDSVVSQTFINWECIIVNDGSPDNTNEVAQKLIAKHPNKIIRLLEKPNGGLADARNAGITISQGIYWLPLDADDTIATTFLEKTVQILETRSDVGFVYSHIQHFGTQHNVYYLPDFDADTIIHTDNIGCVCSLVRKSVWKDVGGYNAEMKEGYEDWDFWVGCIEKGWKGYRIAEALFNYRKKENTMLHQANTKREKLIARIILNHPGLYHKRRLTWAGHILQEKGTGSRPFRVLIVCTHFWPSLGGLETIAEFLGNYLVRTGYQVDVATLYRQDRSFNAYRGINIISLDTSRKFNDTPLWIIQLRQLVTSGQYDACILLADPLNPIIWSLHQADIHSNTKIIIQPLINKDGYAKWYDNKAFRRNLADILKKAHAVVALTRDGVERQYFEEEGISSILIPNAVDVIVPTTDFRTEFNISKKSFVILHIANLWPVKNHLGILNALRLMPPDWRLVMIGYPSQEHSYVLQVQEAIRRNPQVVYIPGLPREGVAAALEAADVVILASNGEVSPVTILEAMSHKKPWVATPECGSVHDLAGGVIVPLHNFTKVLGLLANSEYLQKLGSIGYEHWQACYCWSTVILAWDELIQTGATQKTFSTPESVKQKQKTLQAQIIEKLNKSTSLDTTVTHQPESPMHRVSIIVPTYNRPDFLTKALESIADQTYNNCEVIVVNDAGEDVSAVVEDFRDRLAITYLVHDTNKDRAAARNTALKHVSGQYIAYLDDDDIFYPDHIETALKVLTTTDYKIVYTDACRACQIKAGNSYQTIKKDVPYSTDYTKGIFYKTNITPILCVIHDKACFEGVGMFDESLPVLEDWDLWIRMAEKYDFCHIKKVTCEFSWREDGTSTTSNKAGEFARVRRLIYERYSKQIQALTAQQKIVSIIMLTWNALDYTKKCVNSIQHHTSYPHEIIFVDNASSDGTVEYLRNLMKEHSNYKLIENKGNRGFAAGNNQGVAVASGEYVCLLNNDVLVSDGWLESLVESLEKDGQIGMVGPITNSISGRQMVNSIPYTDEAGFHGFSQKIRKACSGRLTPRYRIAGFAMLMKKSLYEEVGGLDESFGSGNYEDDDLCLKIRDKGYAIMVDESVFIHHYRSQTFIENKINYRSNLSVNESKFIKKWPDVDYKSLLELDKSLVDINADLVSQGQKLIESGNTDEAIKVYLKVLITNPIDEAALCGIGMVYQMVGKTDGAIGAYKKVIRKFSQQPRSGGNSCLLDAYHNVALLYAGANQFDDAIFMLKKAIELSSSDASLLNNLGVLYFKKKMHPEAAQCFSDALSIDAHYEEAKKNLEKVLISCNNNCRKGTHTGTGI